MDRHGEHLQALERELRSFGLRPAFARQPKHIEITWRTPDGSLRRFIASSTPSSYRTTLNERARLRKLCRADGLRRQEEQSGAGGTAVLPSLLALGLNINKSNRVAQLDQIEAELAALTDLVLDWISRGPQVATRVKRQQTRARTAQQQEAGT